MTTAHLTLSRSPRHVAWVSPALLLIDGSALWEVDAPGPRWELPLRGLVTQVAVTPSGWLAVVARADEPIVTIDLEAGTFRGGPIPHHGRAVAISPDGTHLAFAGPKSRLEMIDVFTGKPARDFGRAKKTAGDAWSIAFTPDRKRLIAGMYAADRGESYAVVWDFATCTPTEVVPHAGPILAVGFQASGGAWSISGGPAPSLVLHTGAKKPPAVRFEGPREPVQAALSPDGRVVAFADPEDGAGLRLWDATTGAACATLAGEGGGCAGVAFSPDGRVAWTQGNAVHVHDVPSR